jgi:hypothetical protein
MLLDVSGSMKGNAIIGKNGNPGILFQFFSSPNTQSYDDIVIFPWSDQLNDGIRTTSTPNTNVVVLKENGQMLKDLKLFTLEQCQTTNFKGDYTEEKSFYNAILLCFRFIRDHFTSSTMNNPKHMHYIVPLTDGIFSPQNKLEKKDFYELSKQIKKLRNDGYVTGNIIASSFLSIKSFDENFLRFAKVLDCLFFCVENPSSQKGDFPILSFPLKSLPPIQLLKISAKDKSGQFVPIFTSQTLQPLFEDVRYFYVGMSEYQGLPIFCKDLHTVFINDIPLQTVSSNDILNDTLFQRIFNRVKMSQILCRRYTYDSLMFNIVEYILSLMLNSNQLTVDRIVDQTIKSLVERFITEFKRTMIDDQPQFLIQLIEDIQLIELKINLFIS